MAGRGRRRSTALRRGARHDRAVAELGNTAVTDTALTIASIDRRLNGPCAGATPASANGGCGEGARYGGQCSVPRSTRRETRPLRSEEDGRFLAGRRRSVKARLEWTQARFRRAWGFHATTNLASRSYIGAVTGGESVRKRDQREAWDSSSLQSCAAAWHAPLRRRGRRLPVRSAGPIFARPRPAPRPRRAVPHCWDLAFVDGRGEDDFGPPGGTRISRSRSPARSSTSFLMPRCSASVVVSGSCCPPATSGRLAAGERPAARPPWGTCISRQIGRALRHAAPSKIRRCLSDPGGPYASVGLGVVLPIVQFDASHPTEQAVSIGNNIWDFAPTVAFTYTSPPLLAEGTEVSAKFIGTTTSRTRPLTIRAATFSTSTSPLRSGSGVSRLERPASTQSRSRTTSFFGVPVVAMGRRLEGLQLGGINVGRWCRRRTPPPTEREHDRMGREHRAVLERGHWLGENLEASAKVRHRRRRSDGRRRHCSGMINLTAGNAGLGKKLAACVRSWQRNAPRCPGAFDQGSAGTGFSARVWAGELVGARERARSIRRAGC